MVIPTKAIFHGRASRQAEVGRRSLRFAFQVAGPVTSVSHYRGSGFSVSLCLPPAPICLFSPVESRPVGVHGRRRERKTPRSVACACSYCHSASLPARGMNGCGPTALVLPDRGHRRRRDCARGERASQRLGPLCPTLGATGAELRPAVDLRGAFGNKVNHAVAGFGLYESSLGTRGLGPGG